jgi:predicted transglutaminase-like cysteine proteinase
LTFVSVGVVLEGAMHAELELALAQNRLDRRRALAMVRTAIAGDEDEARSLIDRLYTAGYRDRDFLELAYAWSRERRDLDDAYRFAEALHYETKEPRPFDQVRLARVLHDRGSYGVALSFCEGVGQGKELEARCLLRLNQLRSAHEAYRMSGLGDDHRLAWLEEVVARGRQPRRASWYGRRTTPPPKHAKLDWRERVLKAKLRIDTKNFADVDRFINDCHYVADERLFGEAEHWQTPEAFEHNGAGDCEDFALWVWVQLLRQGVNARFVVGALSAWEMNHAFVAIYHPGGRVEVLECTPQGYNIAIDSKSAIEYVPMISIDRTLTWYEH